MIVVAMTPFLKPRLPDHWSHATVQVLAAYATALSVMHEAIRAGWPDGAYEFARAAVRAARMLTLKGEYK